MNAELLFKDPREYIQFEFEARRTRRPAYSMRAFARDLDISPSSLNDFMKGRVGMSQARVASIARHLRWSEMRTEHFSDLISSKFAPHPGARQAATLRLRKRLKKENSGFSVEAFKVLTDWYHLVILEICEIQDHIEAPKVAKELDLTLAEVKEALKRLQRLGLIQLTEKGLKPTEALSHFGGDQPSEAIVNFHSQILNLTQKSLQEKTMYERYNQSIVFSMHGAESEAMYTEIEKSVLGIINKYAQTPKKDSVQVFNMHSFAVAKIGDQ